MNFDAEIMWENPNIHQMLYAGYASYMNLQSHLLADEKFVVHNACYGFNLTIIHFYTFFAFSATNMLPKIKYQWHSTDLKLRYSTDLKLLSWLIECIHIKNGENKNSVLWYTTWSSYTRLRIILVVPGCGCNSNAQLLL